MSLAEYSFSDPITVTTASSIPGVSLYRSDLVNTVTLTQSAANAVSLSASLSLPTATGLIIAAGAPSTTTNTLYSSTADTVTSLFFNGSAVGFTRRAVADANFVITTTASIIVPYTSISAARTLTLPSATVAGQIVWVIDSSGSVTSTNTITISRGGTDTFEGVGTTWVINSAYGAACFESNGAGKWAVLTYEELPLIMNNADITITNREDVIVLITAAFTANRNINLPAATTTGQRITIVDCAGGFGSYDAIINRAGSDTINNALTSYAFGSNYGYVECVASGTTKWNISQETQIGSGGSLITSGAYPITFSTTAASTVTMPASTSATLLHYTSAPAAQYAIPYAAAISGLVAYTAAGGYGVFVSGASGLPSWTTAAIGVLAQTGTTTTPAMLAGSYGTLVSSATNVPSWTTPTAGVLYQASTTTVPAFSPTPTMTLPVFSTGATFTASTGGTTAGETWYDSTRLMLSTYANGIKGFSHRTLYSQYGTVTVATTASITTLLGGTALGTATLPANYFIAGKALRIKACGYYGTYSTAPTIIFTVLFGATTIGITGALTTTLSMSNMGWEAEIIINAVSTTSIWTKGWVRLSTSATAGTAVNNITSGGTATTAAAVTVGTTSQALGLSVTWGTSNAANTISCVSLIVEELC